MLLDETDLARILAEAGIPPDRASELTATEAFHILRLAADLFCQRQLRTLPAKLEEATLAGKHLAEELATVIAATKDRLGDE